MNIILIGFMGTGKSTVGKLLASRLGFDFVDTDSMIEVSEGMSIKEIFSTKGESYFRSLEADAISKLSSRNRCVISTGGGAVLSEDNMKNLKKAGTVICLKSSPEIILQRTSGQGTRPLLESPDPAAAIEEKLNERKHLYKGDFILDTSDMTPEDAAARIITFINYETAAPSRMTVELGADSYEIHAGCGLLQNIDSLLGKAFSGSNIMVVSNPTIYSLWGHLLEKGLKKLTDSYFIALVPDGEEYKSLAAAEELYEKAVTGKLDRKSLIIAFGGGVIGDLAGFVAATYMRGIPYVQIPTTLLAQVDSSVGGKVAVNHSKGKNLIGSFYQPRMVISDLLTLLTLPERELSNGLAEVIKCGMINDSALFNYLEQNISKVLRYDMNCLLELVAASCRIKADIVSKDEKETGIRAILNYGHTIGHGLEASTTYTHFRHGEAIAIGMEGAAMLAMKHGLLAQADCTRQRELLRQAGLPVGFAGMDAGKVQEAIRADKKNENGRLRMIMPTGIGSAEINCEISFSELEAVLEYLKK